MLCNACYAKHLIVPPHDQNQFPDFPRIEVPYDLTPSLDTLVSLSLSKKPSHPAIERPLSCERPAEYDGVPGEETMMRQRGSDSGGLQ